MEILKVYLAPMDGVCDPPLRKVLSKTGGFDECFSEFIRVSDLVLPYKTLLREVPELENGGKTLFGTPVRVQLLGDNPDLMAKTAKRAEELGALGIDLNFGCPSRFVHHAGAMLLREPGLIRDIVKACCDILDPNTLLSVKIRAGFASKDEAPGLIEAIAQEGVDEIIVHARTRDELYREDALDWGIIKSLHKIAPGITIVANGEIVSRESALECAAISGCQVLMAGRGALMVPNLGYVIKEGAVPFDNERIIETALDFMHELELGAFPEKLILDRVKQFLSYARRSNESLGEFFKVICKVVTMSDAKKLLHDKIAAKD